MRVRIILCFIHSCKVGATTEPRTSYALNKYFWSEWMTKWINDWYSSKNTSECWVPILVPALTLYWSWIFHLTSLESIFFFHEQNWNVEWHHLQTLFQFKIQMCPVPTGFIFLFLFLFSYFPLNSVCFSSVLIYLPVHRQSPAFQVLPHKVRIWKFIRPWSMEANSEELAFPLPQIIWVIKRLISKLITKRFPAK